MNAPELGKSVLHKDGVYSSLVPFPIYAFICVFYRFLNVQRDEPYCRCTYLASEDREQPR